MKYAPLPPISQADAEQEAEDTRLFAPRITISTTVQYHGRQLVITAEDMSADKFCDLLDRRFGKTDDAPIFRQPTNGHAPASTEPPICPQHNRPMKRMNWASKEGHLWHCTAKVGDGWCAERA